jgi:hypothetical protein
MAATGWQGSVCQVLFTNVLPLPINSSNSTAKQQHEQWVPKLGVLFC